MQFESWIDRQIREAVERGEFDNLPGAGKPLHLSDDPDWWIKAKMERENLDAVLPSGVMLRKEVDNIQETLSDVKSETQAREICEDLNQRIREYYQRDLSGPRIIVRVIDVDAELRSWRDGL